ncbi:hypothetical protein QYF36_012413 [Acer negundo]|nr:hypothetical protein QYF36_012413 [Acer negundo]
MHILEQRELPPVANQNQRELPLAAIPAQEGLFHGGNEHTLRDYTMPRFEQNIFFPPRKAARLRNEILSSQQFENESIYEAWERFKVLQRRCPHNGLAKWQTLQAFYQGITMSTRNLVDAAAEGSLMSKLMDAANDLLEEMELNNSQWGTQKEVDNNTRVQA